MPMTSKTILDSLPDPIIVLDEDRRVIEANKAALDLMPSDMIGHNLAHSLRHPGALKAADMVLQGEPEYLAEIELPPPLRRSFSLHAVRLSEKNHEYGSRVVLLMHETTAAKRAEQMRADFVANVSHELRSPLSALVGFIETLQGPAKEDKEAQQHFLEIMAKEAGRMTRLIEDLLSLSGVEINEHVRPRGRVDIGRIVKSVTESLSVRAAERNLTIELAGTESAPPVLGDPDQLIQVVQNLVDNAIKYGGRDSAIRVRVAPVDRLPQTGGPGVSVAVQDFGEGIPEDQVSRLTERFYRVDKARSRSLGGTGLGLAIVKHIINRHRGSLSIESDEGKGSTFSVVLPVFREHEQNGTQPA
ncbi:MAG: ATP-binding protein [Rhodospirillales bacterium]